MRTITFWIDQNQETFFARKDKHQTGKKQVVKNVFLFNFF